MIVYVAASAGDSSAAFEWRHTREDAIEAIRPLVADGDDTNISIVDVPDGLSRDDTTAWLDSNPALWEPAYGERSLPTSATEASDD